MITSHNKESLICFEEKVCELFHNKQILAPVHLYSGNERQMIDIFKNVKEEDWVFCSWRSHYQCLLKGVPENYLLEEIKKGAKYQVRILKQIDVRGYGVDYTYENPDITVNPGL